MRWTVIYPLDITIQPLNNFSQILGPQTLKSFILFKFQKQLVELTGTLEEERLRARRLQNERDVQQASAMSHKEKERQIKSDLENEKKKRAQLEQKLEKEREKNTSLNKELNERETKLNELRQDFETQSLKQSEKVSTLIRQMSSLFAFCFKLGTCYSKY